MVTECLRYLPVRKNKIFEYIQMSKVGLH